MVLLGLFIDNSLYNDQGRTFFLPNLADNPLAKLLQWLGRHSLTIYLLHQPILFAIFFGLYFVRQ